ncbi:hypothetical protein [Flavobacterium ginsengisoli]
MNFKVSLLTANIILSNIISLRETVFLNNQFYNDNQEYKNGL